MNGFDIDTISCDLSIMGFFNPTQIEIGNADSKKLRYFRFLIKSTNNRIVSYETLRILSTKLLSSNVNVYMQQAKTDSISIYLITVSAATIPLDWRD